MSNLWILLVAAYGILKGMRDVFKKKAMEKSSVMEVLFFYTLLSFILVLPQCGDALEAQPTELIWTFVKSLAIFIAWICSFKAINEVPISFYGVMDMAQLIFSTLLGVLILHEAMTPLRLIGFALVLIGLYLVNLKKSGGDRKIKPKYIIMILVSCLFNAVSGTFDKVLMQTMTSSQLQFWYMLFLTLMYAVYIIATRQKPDFRAIYKNLWIPLLAVLFVIGDKALFIANANPNSHVVVMTLIKQCSVLVTIVGGKLMFGEKNIFFRICCALVIIAGITVATASSVV